MLKYGNRFYTPYDSLRHTYPYMPNRRLSTLLHRYRWRAQSPVHRPRLILITLAIVALLWYAIQILAPTVPIPYPGLPLLILYESSCHGCDRSCHHPLAIASIMAVQLIRLRSDNHILQPQQDSQQNTISILHTLKGHDGDRAECDTSTSTVGIGRVQTGSSKAQDLYGKRAMSFSSYASSCGTLWNLALGKSPQKFLADARLRLRGRGRPSGNTKCSLFLCPRACACSFVSLFDFRYMLRILP